MKKAWFLLAALLMIFSLCSCSGGTNNKSEISYYVSPDGNDSNPGTLDQPFATVQKARDTIRQKYAGAMPSDICVYLRGGDYYMAESLQFTAADSGKNGHQVYYKNYKGEKPYIHGGTLLTGWTADAGGIYKVTLGDAETMNTLYEDGAPSFIARSPNSGYLIADSADTSTKIDELDAAVTFSPGKSDNEEAGWKAGPTEDAYLGAQIYTSLVGAYAEATFTGTSIKWFGRAFPYGGLANVYIDGVLDATADGYLAEVEDQHEIYSKEGLTNGPHTIRIEVTGKKNDSAEGTYVVVDLLQSQVGPASPVSNTKFRFQNNDIPQVAHPEDLEIQMWPSGPGTGGILWKWFRQYKRIDTVDFDTKFVTLQPFEKDGWDDMYYPIGTGSTYLVQNAKELLDQPGEFFMDRRAKPNVLYYYPRSAAIASAAIVKPISGPVIGLLGDSAENTVHDITFEGLTVGDSDRGFAGISLDNFCKSITVKGCMIKNTGDHGVQMRNWNQNNTVSGCDIHDIGNSGVFLTNIWGPTLNDYSNHNTITNNHIYRTGLLVGEGSGIYLEQSSNNTVSHNRIHDIPKAGILLSTVQLRDVVGETIEGVNARESNFRLFTHTDHNLIEYNELSNCTTDTQDVGAIYHFCCDFNTISNNSIHDSDVYWDAGIGIYLDGHSDDIVVSNNLVYNLQQRSPTILQDVISLTGFRDTVTNNYLVNNRTPGHGDGGLILNAIYGPWARHVITKNVFYADQGDVYQFEAWADDSTIDTSDYNVYYFKNGEYTVSGLDIVQYKEWQRLDNKKYDQNSIQQDPLFMDIAKGDYRLRHDSPAYALGVQDIDMQNIGLTADFPFADPADGLGAIYVKKAGDKADKSFVELAKGEKADLTVLARSVTGYVVDPGKLTVSYTIDNSSVGSVSAAGHIEAKEAGTARITVVVKLGEVEMSKAMDLIVK